MSVGSFTFVLHSHLPYARRAGRWPHGEEWIHEAASETYLPLIQALRRVPPGDQPMITLGLTPVLVEQLADAHVMENLVTFMEERREGAYADIKRFTKEDNAERLRVAHWYADWYSSMLRLLCDDLGGNIVGAFKALQDEGAIEIATSAATHGYLPLMSRDSTIRAQIGTGVRAYRRHFGRDPRSFWLPECAYRPAYIADTPEGRVVRPGLEHYLAEFGLRVFFVETHTIEGGRPVGKAAGDAIGPYEEIRRRWVAPLPPSTEPTNHTTFQPYYVARPEVAAIGRNNRTGLQVWSGEHGYPGEARYREFHKRDGESGLHYWRVTGPRVDLGDKLLWDPEDAFNHTGMHADHFAGLVHELLRDYQQQNGKPGIIAANYDTELFGHWWFEGVEWLGGVLQRLRANPEVELTSAGTHVSEHAPELVLDLPESSWGEGGGHFVWDNAGNRWMWPVIHAAERRMEGLAANYREAHPITKKVIEQAAREAVLLQSSDWPFLITTGQARDYATERFENHVERFDKLAELAESGQTGDGAANLVDELYDLDNVYPDIDVPLFAAVELSRSR